MNLTNVIINYRRYLKRRNFSHHTLKSYLNKLRQFVLWVDVPIEHVSYQKINAYIDYLLARRLRPKTINCHLNSIRRFYSYLHYEEQIAVSNPVRTGCKLRLSQPLPRHLKGEQVLRLFDVIKSGRDRAMFMLMLRCGLRVEEVANLSLAAIDWRRSRLYVFNGKGQKDRVVYISHDTYKALAAYVKQRLSLRTQRQTAIGTGNPETHGVLCKENRAAGILSSAAPHHGNPAAQCRCGSGLHPGSFGPQPHQNNATLLPCEQPESATGLL
jgi:site-specific recombinase XerD